MERGAEKVKFFLKSVANDSAEQKHYSKNTLGRGAKNTQICTIFQFNSTHTLIYDCIL